MYMWVTVVVVFDRRVLVLFCICGLKLLCVCCKQSFDISVLCVVVLVIPMLIFALLGVF